MKKVGFIGWRGMVGSVLMGRMEEENDFANIDPVFFTTSQAGQKAPVFCLRFRSTVQIPYKWAALRMPFLATVAHERRFQQQWTAVLPANKAVSMFLAVVLHLV